MTSFSTYEPLVDDASRSSRSRIRALAEGDLGRINELYERSAGHPLNGSTALFKRVLFDSPWRDGSLSSLVCEDESGRVIASLGIMPRPMKFRGRLIRAAVGHHLIVEPSRRGTRAAIELGRCFIR